MYYHNVISTFDFSKMPMVCLPLSVNVLILFGLPEIVFTV